MAKKKAAKKSAGKKPAAKKSAKKKGRKKAGRRELIDTGSDKRLVRRNKSGQFKESDDLGRSLSQDVRKSAKTEAPRGQGDRGDRRH